ncbi:MAG: protein translocase subunit SecF [Candidatus Neomarinimicrobiota bacterium]|jgi:preprotein translocase SecF subunit|nr:protein translocase subunit SecF [Candidatus Neomarinimicrobiota bacterium]MEE3139225.1 protein translocase subunit SecF [Candidatus Neomarinimicrobiota bacterium]|tara:strand:+ start:2486 stop:3406 length:921 start_codon:yes stop_codon:yes gene_type:complete
MEIIKNTNINFMASKNVGFTISSICFVLSLFMLFSGLNLGIDFRGGTMIGLNFSEEVEIQEIRAAMQSISIEGQEFDLSTEEIKHFGNSTNVMIKFKVRDDAPENFEQEIVNHLYQNMNEKVPEDKNNFILSIDTVSPKIGSELSGKALWSIISALGLILFYISIRFEFKFAIGAILALVHDVIITLGIFSFTGYEITLGTVAAFLTIVGYSLNDTIVILDRIRENMKSSGTVLFESTINKSINQSLSRTLITSFTTLLVIIVLIYAGGEIIRPFAFTMLVGVIIGTYSSIYIASGLLASLYKSSN